MVIYIGKKEKEESKNLEKQTAFLLYFLFVCYGFKQKSKEDF